MSNGVISNKQFWLCSFGLLLIWIVVLTAAVPSTSIKVNEKNCKALCQHCGCIDFYCGEECICECNDEKSDTECINVMQTNARNLNIPFQLLIQGPNSNRFVRNALAYGQEGRSAAPMPPAHRNRRSTIVIYKPAFQNALDETANEARKSLLHLHEAGALRHKRAVGQQLDWFSDFANTLVRPAPLASAKKSKTNAQKAAESGSSNHKRATSKNVMDRSWFSEDNAFLLRPAPLFKRPRSRSNGGGGGGVGEQSDSTTTDQLSELVSTPMNAAVESLPSVFKDTLRNIQKSTMGGGEATGDLGDSLLSQIKEGTNVLQSQLMDNNLEMLPGADTFRDNIQETLSNWHSKIFNAANEERTAEAPPPTKRRAKAASKFSAARPRFNWFRPVRFLHRVQQAIN